MKRLSIISVNYNNGDGLEKTIASVAAQTFRDFEYIVVDGGSTDKSLNIIKKFGNGITTWTSERDTGVYDAMNKGLLTAQGEYVLMLNSGDTLYNDSILATVFNNVGKDRFDLIYGDLIWDEKGNRRRHSLPDQLNFNYFRKYSLGHQATFIRKEIHQTIGVYDDQLRIMADWKFFLLAVCKFNVSYQHLPLPIAICGRDGMSCNPQNFGLIDEEREQVMKEYFPAFLQDYRIADQDSAELLAFKRAFLYKSLNRLVKLQSRILAKWRV